MHRWAWRTAVSMVGVLASSCAHGQTVTVTRPPAGPLAADQVHLGVGPDPATTVVVQWHTNAGVPDTVRLTGPNGTKTVTGDEPKPPPIGVGRFHRVTLAGLRPATRYHYEVATGRNQFAFPYSFATPAAGPAPVRFDAFADQGDCQHFRHSCTVIAGIAADHPSFVIAAGDLSYGTENGLAADDTWATDIMKWSTSAPLLPTWGNHETDYPRDPLTNVKARYAAPGNGDYYSVTYSGVHVVTLPERDVPVDPLSPFHQWLAADLAAAHADPNVRWIVAFGHRPIYTSGTRHGPEQRLRADIVTLLEQAGVALVVNGHEHNYERTLPVRAGVAGSTDVGQSRVQDGIVYVVTGGGGATTYDDFGPVQPWDAVRKVTHEHLRIDATLDRLDVTTIDDKAKTIDHFVISH